MCHLFLDEDMDEALILCPLLQSLRLNLGSHIAQVRAFLDDADCFHISSEQDAVLSKRPLSNDRTLSSILRTLLNDSHGFSKRETIFRHQILRIDLKHGKHYHKEHN